MKGILYMYKRNALIMVDLQNDFCSGGNLAVPGGEEVIPLANRLQPFFDVVLATKDWHPGDHTSFAANHPGNKIGEVVKVGGIPQVLWPSHCVQNSKGAEWHPDLHTEAIAHVFYKGVDQSVDSYSAFFDNKHARSTGLGDYLRNERIENIYIMGLATDYCVKYSSLDAAHLGFHVYVIEDACRGVELNAGDIQSALAEMQKSGIKLIKSTDILKPAALSKMG